MADIGIVGPSYPAGAFLQDAQECINWLPEIDASLPEGRNTIALYPTPGLKTLLQLPEQAEVRVVRSIGNNNYLVAVCGAGAYLVDNLFTDALLIGKLNSSSGVITSADNTKNYYVVDRINRYTYRIPTRFPRYAKFLGTIVGNTLTVSEVLYGPIRANYSILNPTSLPRSKNSTVILSGSENTWTLNRSFRQPDIALFHAYESDCLFSGYISNDILTVKEITRGSLGTGVSLLSNLTNDLNVIITETSVEDISLTGAGDVGTYRVNAEILNGSVSAVFVQFTGTNFTAIPSVTVQKPENGFAAIIVVDDLTAAGAVVQESTDTTATVGMVLNVLGGEAILNNTCTLSVTEISATGAVVSVTILNNGNYDEIPQNPVSVLELANTTFFMGFGVGNITLKYGGSGYLRNPIVTVSGTGVGAQINATVANPPVTETFNALPFTVLPQTDGPFDNAVGVDIVDNTFVYANSDVGQKFAQSDILSPITNPLSVIVKDASPDPIIGCKVLNRDVFVFGSHTTEVWFNTGPQADAPFTTLQRLQGASSQEGCASFNTVQRLGNSLAYLSSNLRGTSQVVLLNGYIPKRISNHAVEASIADKYVSDAFAFTYILGGHEVYVITFPTLDLTWAFDLASAQWHKWLDWDNTNAVWRRHRSNCLTQFSDRIVLGDYKNGKLYELRSDVYTEDGDLIHRLRRTPHAVADYKQTMHSALQIYFQTGANLKGKVPQAMLRWSNDGGANWSEEYWKDLEVGLYKRRAIWRRLGRARDRVYELRVSDPIKWVVISSELAIEIGAH